MKNVNCHDIFKQKLPFYFNPGLRIKIAYEVCFPNLNYLGGNYVLHATYLAFWSYLDVFEVAFLFFFFSFLLQIIEVFEVELHSKRLTTG